MPPIEWTEGLIDALCEMVCEGLSTRHMAERIGHPMTKNAIIGKFRRLGLPLAFYEGGKRREDVVMPHNATLTPVYHVEHIFAPTDPESAPVSSRPVVLKASPRSVSDWEGAAGAIDKLKYGDCKYPMGEVFSDDFAFCCEPAEAGKPYCADHTSTARGVGTYAERKALSPLNRRAA